jgi:hypothetical protein
MRFSVLAGAALIAGTCTSCTTPEPPDPTKLVAVADVMNSVFCGLGLFVNKAKDLAKQQGSADYPLYAKLTLGLKVINSNSIGISAGQSSDSGGGSGRSGGGSGSSGGSRSGGGSVARTSVVAGATPAIVPSFGLSSTSGWTVDTVTELNFQLNKVNPAVCLSANVAPTNGDDSPSDFGLSNWLAHTLAVYAAANGSISGGYQDYDSTFNYDATFAVDTKAGGKLGYQLSIIPLSANADTSQNNVQKLSLVISNKALSSGGGGGGGGGGGSRSRDMLPTPFSKSGGEPVPLSEIKPVPYF